jgi:hypothetical protein
MSTPAISHADELRRRSAHAMAGPAVRELDFRSSDGTEVRLLWNSRTERVSVTVHDGPVGESMAFEVDPADALRAFHHPYAYAATLPSNQGVY